jgi:hypothetical protein
MGEYVAAFLLKSPIITDRAFLLYIIFRKNELKLSNREVNPEVSGHCADGTVCLGVIEEYVAAFLLKSLSKLEAFLFSRYPPYKTIKPPIGFVV